MKKQSVIIGITAGLLAVLLAQQQSYAQYDDTGTVGISEETLQRCKDLDIRESQCTEANVLAKERVDWFTENKGSGTALFATESGQLIVFIGALGAIFGGVAGAFFVMGRKAKQVTSA
ncbi:MAG: hypothetical protein ACREA4_01435 [Nitrososphaera sp.]